MPKAEHFSRLAHLVSLRPWHLTLASLALAILFAYFGPRRIDTQVKVNAAEILEMLKDSAVTSCNYEAKDGGFQVVFSRQSSFALGLHENEASGKSEPSVVVRQQTFTCVRSVGGQTIVTASE